MKMRSYRSKGEGLPEMVAVKVAGMRTDRGRCVGSGLRTAGKEEVLVGKLVRMEWHKPTSAGRSLGRLRHRLARDPDCAGFQ